MNSDLVWRLASLSSRQEKGKWDFLKGLRVRTSVECENTQVQLASEKDMSTDKVGLLSSMKATGIMNKAAKGSEAWQHLPRVIS